MDRRSLIALAPMSVLAMSTTRIASACAGQMQISESYVNAWIDAYARAWVDKDADGAAALFSEDAVYEAIPGVPEQTFVGREAIRGYWADITAAQSEVTIMHGQALVQRNRAAVELWVTMNVPALNPEADHMVTLLETNILSFEPSGLCCHNAEYWNLLMGIVQPPADWGT